MLPSLADLLDEAPQPSVDLVSRGGKFLGYMISHRGIEANPAKQHTILHTPPPSTIKKVQQLNGCLAALNRFTSSSAAKVLHFFKSPKKSQVI